MSIVKGLSGRQGRAALAVVLLAGFAGWSASAAAAGVQHWLVRLRGVVLVPDDSSGAVSGIPGSGVGVSTDAIPELDISYFFDPHWAAELILGSSRHDLSGRGSIAALGTIGHVRTLPPTLTLQYHFGSGRRIRPYLGIGVNYTHFFNPQPSASLDGALGTTSIHLDDSWGVAGQGGVDVALGAGWFANVDVKYIDLGTTARLTSTSGVRVVDVQINPVLVGFGIGRRF